MRDTVCEVTEFRDISRQRLTCVRWVEYHYVRTVQYGVATVNSNLETKKIGRAHRKDVTVTLIKNVIVTVFFCGVSSRTSKMTAKADERAQQMSQRKRYRSRESTLCLECDRSEWRASDKASRRRMTFSDSWRDDLCVTPSHETFLPWFQVHTPKTIHLGYFLGGVCCSKDWQMPSLKKRLTFWECERWEGESEKHRKDSRGLYSSWFEFFADLFSSLSFSHWSWALLCRILQDFYTTRVTWRNVPIETQWRVQPRRTTDSKTISIFCHRGG